MQTETFQGASPTHEVTLQPDEGALLWVFAGNGCEDGACDLTIQTVQEITSYLTRWLNEHRSDTDGRERKV